jgi:hypothetical protein
MKNKFISTLCLPLFHFLFIFTSSLSATGAALPDRLSQFKPGVGWQWWLEDSQAVADKAVLGKAPFVYDIDLLQLTASDVQKLKQKNKVLICYVAGGSLQFSSKATYDSRGRVISCKRRVRSYARPELKSFLDKISSSAIAGYIKSWPDNCWLDPREPSVQLALQGIIEMARKKGCDGIEFDNMDAGLDQENRKEAGFPKSADMVASQILFNKKVAQYTRSQGLFAGLKNGHLFADQQCANFDFAVVEDIIRQAGEDDTAKQALAAWQRCARTGRPIFSAEYPSDWTKYRCPKVAGLSVNYFKDRQYVNGGIACPSAPLIRQQQISMTTKPE